MPAEPSLPPNEQAAATAEAKRMLRMLGDRFLTDHAHCARVASEARAIGEFAGDTELMSA